MEKFSREYRVIVIQDGDQTIGMVSDLDQLELPPKPIDLTTFPLFTGVELRDGDKFSVTTSQHNNGDVGFRSGKIEFVPLVEMQ